MTIVVGKPTVFDQLNRAKLDRLDVDSAPPVVVRGPAEPDALPPSGGVAEPVRDGWADIARAHATAAANAAAGEAGQALLNGAAAANGLAEPGLPPVAPGTLQIDIYEGMTGTAVHNPNTTAGFVAKAETAQMARRDAGIAEAAANIGVGSKNTAAAKDAGAAAAAGASSRGDVATALGAAGAVAVPVFAAPAMPANATAGVSATAAVNMATPVAASVGVAAQVGTNEVGDVDMQVRGGVSRQRA